jgi:hypothetical protein
MADPRWIVICKGTRPIASCFGVAHRAPRLQFTLSLEIEMMTNVATLFFVTVASGATLIAAARPLDSSSRAMDARDGAVEARAAEALGDMRDAGPWVDAWGGGSPHSEALSNDARDGGSNAASAAVDGSR